MSSTDSCEHPVSCFWAGECQWCRERDEHHEEVRLLSGKVRQLTDGIAEAYDRIDDLERDNKALTEQLGKQSLMLQPGRHDFGNVECGFVVLLPGASIGGPHEPLTITSDPPNAETPAKSWRELCPKCGKPSEIVSIPFGDSPMRLSCGCETRDREWLNRSHAQEKRYYAQQKQLHAAHASKCPCEPCAAGREWTTAKGADATESEDAK